MKLTEKCKEDFEVFLFNKSIWVYWFYTLSKSMQYGVYVDFFDWAGIIIRVEYNHRYKLYWFELNSGALSYDELNRWNYRETAREKAIEKANEIYNKK
jgi:hypothetical protein